VIGASGFHVDTKNFAKMKDGASDKNIAFLLLEDKAEGPHYHQEWQDMPLTEAFLAGGEVSALRLKLFVSSRRLTIRCVWREIFRNALLRLFLAALAAKVPALRLLPTRSRI
jgi:hypothetical protein